MNYITLELDTTPPKLEIYAPKYTTKETENHITIESDEVLGSYQEIYVVDSNGNRYDLQFDNKENNLIGIVKFNELTYGIATLYVRVKDEVDNISEIYSHEIEVKESISRLRMDISHNVRPLFIYSTTMGIETNDSTREMILNNEI